jgi:hypothetical protein
MIEIGYGAPPNSEREKCRADKTDNNQSPYGITIQQYANVAWFYSLPL